MPHFLRLSFQAKKASGLEGVGGGREGRREGGNIVGVSTFLLFPSFHHCLTTITNGPLQIICFYYLPFLFNYYDFSSLHYNANFLDVGLIQAFYSSLFYSIPLPSFAYQIFSPYPFFPLTQRWSDCQILYSRLAVGSRPTPTASPPLPPPRLSSITADTAKPCINEEGKMEVKRKKTD